MKLTKLFEQDETLTEGLKYGQKEENLVRKEGKNLQIGIEFEYHVHDEHFEKIDPSDNDVYQDDLMEKARELQEEASDEWETDFKETYIDDEFSNDDVENMTATISSARDIAYSIDTSLQEAGELHDEVESEVGDWDEDDFDDEDNFYMGFDDEDVVDKINEYIDHIQGIQGDLSELTSLIDEIEGNSGGVKDAMLFDSIDFYDISSNLFDIENMREDFPSSVSSKDDIEELQGVSFHNPMDLLNSLQPLIDLQGSDADWDDDFKEYYKERAEDAYNDYGESENPYNLDYVGIDDRFIEEAEGEIDYADYVEGNSEADDFIDDVLNDSDNPWGVDPMHIYEVTTDASVSDGVEVITLPLNLDDTLENMENMFEHIRDVGYTSSNTGMHVNMSMKGLHFNRKTFNHTKMVMLMDEKYLIDQFGIRNSNVDAMFENVSAQTLINVATARNTNDMIERMEEDFIRQSHKFQTINFKNTFGDGAMGMESLVEDRRIEFRFFGGDDYEKHYDKMEKQILRSAYMMMVAFSPTFGHKEYLKKMTQQLDRSFKKKFMMSFTDFTKRWRKLTNREREEIMDTFIMNKSNVSLEKEGALLMAILLRYPEFYNMERKWLTSQYSLYIQDWQEMNLTPDEKRQLKINKTMSRTSARQKRLDKIADRQVSNGEVERLGLPR